MAQVFFKTLASVAIAALALGSTALTSATPAQAQVRDKYAVDVDADEFDRPHVVRGISKDYDQDAFRPARSREIIESDDDDGPRVRRTVVERRIIEERVVRPVVEQRIIKRRVQPVIERHVVIERPIVRKVVVQRPLVREVVVERPVVRTTIVRRDVQRRFEPVRVREVVQRRFMQPVY